jgi:hypothetical protein
MKKKITAFVVLSLLVFSLDLTGVALATNTSGTGGCSTIHHVLHLPLGITKTWDTYECP